MKRLQLYAALILSFFVIDWSGLQRYVDELFFWFQLISLVLPIVCLLVLVNDIIRRWVVLTLIGQVSRKSYLSSKKILLTRTTGWDLFWALQEKFVAVHFPAYLLYM